MNWFRKIAGVTFSPIGSYNIAQPMDLMDISNDLLRFGIRNNLFKNIPNSYNTIAPDGDSDFAGPLGTLNFYFPKEIPTDPFLVETLIQAYNQHKIGDIIIEMGPQEISKLNGLDVFRLQVTHNETSSREIVPDLQVANYSSGKIIEILNRFGMNIDDPYGGCINANDYIGARQLMNQETMKEHTEDSAQEKGFYSQGYDIERIERYFDTLDRMANWIVMNKLPDQRICWG